MGGRGIRGGALWCMIWRMMCSGILGCSWVRRGWGEGGTVVGSLLLHSALNLQLADFVTVPMFYVSVLFFLCWNLEL